MELPESDLNAKRWVWFRPFRPIKLPGESPRL